MSQIYKDRAGNKLFITGRHIYAKNKRGSLVNRNSVMRLLRKANRTGAVKFRS